MTASELDALVLEALQRSTKPLTADGIRKAIPRPYRKSSERIADVLENLITEGRVWKWGASAKKPVYAASSPDERARQFIIDALRVPLSAAKLKQIAGRRLDGYPAKEKPKLLKAVLLGLLEEGAVTKIPRRGEQYSRPAAKPDFAEALAALQRDYAGVPAAEAYSAFERIFGPEFTLEERIQRAVLTVEPRARTGGVAWAPDVRLRLSPRVDKDAFDAAVLGMARAGMLGLHEFVGYLELSEEQRRELVFDGQGRYYGGIALRA
jgi:hypothetical protein